MNGFSQTQIMGGLENAGPLTPAKAFSLAQRDPRLSLSADDQKAALQFVRDKGAEWRALASSVEDKANLLRFFVRELEVQPIAESRLPLVAEENVNADWDSTRILAMAAVHGKTRAAAFEELAKLYDESVGKFLLRLVRDARQLNNRYTFLRRYLLLVKELQALDETQKAIANKSNKPFYKDQSLDLTKDEMQAISKEFQDWAKKVYDRRFNESLPKKFEQAKNVPEEQNGVRALLTLKSLVDREHESVLEFLREQNFISARQASQARKKIEKLRDTISEQVLRIVRRDNVPIVDADDTVREFLPKSFDKSPEWQKVVSEQLRNGTTSLAQLTDRLHILSGVNDNDLAEQLEKDQWPAWKVRSNPFLAERAAAQEYLAKIEATGDANREPIAAQNQRKASNTQNVEQSTPRVAMWAGIGIGAALLLALIVVLIVYLVRRARRKSKMTAQQSDSDSVGWQESAFET